MEEPSPAAAEKSWSRSVSERIGRNVKVFRQAHGWSAQALSDQTAALGHPIARSTIANMEGFRKDSTTVQDVAVLAEALRVPFAALLYSPMRPGEDVQPMPNVSVKAYAAVDRLIDWPDERRPASEINVAWDEMRLLTAELNQLHALRVRWQIEEGNLRRAMRGGALRMTPDGPVQDPANPVEIEALEVNLAYWEQEIESSLDRVAGHQQELRDLGIEPWPIEGQEGDDA